MLATSQGKALPAGEGIPMRAKRTLRAATATALVLITTSACGAADTSSGRSASGQQATGGAQDGASGARAASRPGTVTGADSMKIGLDTFYAKEVNLTCSGSPNTPTATLRTSEGWTAVTTAPAGGFGPADVTVTSPEGASHTFASDAKQGPLWNNGTLTTTFGRHESVGGKDWRLYIQKATCL